MRKLKKMTSDAILVINAGSSSIKLSLFDYKALNLIHHQEIKNLSEILKALPNNLLLKAVGHRVVHGGAYFTGPVFITDDIIQKITALIPLAPLHQPHNVEAIQIIQKFYPSVPQIACFDTTFHQTQEKLAKLTALPRKFMEEGIIRYGFHGISYEYIASVLPQHIKSNSNGKIIVAHLGQGASMCAMKEYKSIATTMGFSALDGLMMGTRCGSIDPGVILYLLQEKKFTAEKLTELLYLKSGLFGVSGISNDMRELQTSTNPHAQEAVELFCYKAAKEVAALCVALEGCDGIVFTAGIGENSAIIRKKICEKLSWL
jgi:acetate kinase